MTEPFADLNPGVFRANPFRLTGLPVTASPRELRLRQEAIMTAERLGADPGLGRVPLPVTPAPDAAAVRDALRVIRDPVRRIEAEFLWFWPMPDPDASERAHAALTAGDPEAAARIWHHQGRTGGTARAIGLHNLAVLRHAQALDSGTGLTPRTRAAWTEAMPTWARIADDEALWEHVAARIRELDDPRLAPDTSERMRARLVPALLSINTAIWRESALRNRIAVADFHRDLITASFPSEAAGAVRRLGYAQAKRAEQRRIVRDIESALVEAVERRCWFCGEREARKPCAVERTADGASARTGPDGAEGRPERVTVRIPRCPKCREAHRRRLRWRRWEKEAFTVVVLGGLLAAALASRSLLLLIPLVIAVLVTTTVGVSRVAATAELNAAEERQAAEFVEVWETIQEWASGEPPSWVA